MNRQTTVISLLMTGLLALGPVVAVADGPGETSSPETIPVTTIRRWVADLDSDQFAVRELAMNRLIAAGAQVIDPVVSAMTDDRRETIARGVYVLERLAASGDGTAPETARAALQRLAAEQTSLAARRAVAAIEELALIRQQRAIKALSWLGARIQLRPDPLGNPLRQRPYSIQIDPQWSGTDQHLVHLQSLIDIQRIVFRGPQVNDAWLQAIEPLPNVVSVSVVHARITDQGLAHLSKMPGLQRLNICYTPISDVAVESLRRLGNVQSLLLYGTNISEQGAAALQKELPPASIDLKNGAFLGVRADPNHRPCVISMVVPNSAAQRAGLRIGDIITHYGGKPVDDFEGLRKEIGRNRAGQEVEMTIQRKGQPLAKRVQLGEWDFRQLPN